MESNKSLPLKELKGVLKKLLKKYEDIEDIIIFGSFVKNKYSPKDIDIALVMDKKDYDTARDIEQKIKPKVNISIHTTVILLNEIYTEPVWKSLIAEGFSIKKNRFLKDVIKIKPVEIFSYKIDKMNPTEKMQFNRGFHEAMAGTASIKTGAGSVVVPQEVTGKFEDFFDSWSNKVDKKVYKALLL